MRGDTATVVSEALLSRIRVVLVGAQHPGNVGAVARAMKTMGLDDLALVAPRAFPHPEADALAAGATDLLRRAQVFPTLDAAIADCAHVAGTTARRRYLAAAAMSPRSWAQTLAAGGGRVALLFGRERTGLTNAELARCQALIHIPANPDYPSLNLAQAVQVLAYELRLAATGGGLPTAADHRPAPQAELELFFGHLHRTLRTIGFLKPNRPGLLLRRLRRLFGRAAPDADELAILRGILTAAERAARAPSGVTLGKRRHERSDET